jgi:hypothetical protein
MKKEVHALVFVLTKISKIKLAFIFFDNKEQNETD